ncbi:MAG: TA system VapC family ribonuclease toxin [Kineosporiaceae bacterium]
MTALLDVNVLVALAWPEHLHHSQASVWFAHHCDESWATTPVTELGLLRLSTNPRVVGDALTPAEGIELLRRLRGVPTHQFWPDDIAVGGEDVDWMTVHTHRQVTDARLVGIARRHGGLLATLDRDLVRRHGPDAVLVET